VLPTPTTTQTAEAILGTPPLTVSVHDSLFRSLGCPLMPQIRNHTLSPRIRSTKLVRLVMVGRSTASVTIWLPNRTEPSPLVRFSTGEVSHRSLPPSSSLAKVFVVTRERSRPTAPSRRTSTHRLNGLRFLGGGEKEDATSDLLVALFQDRGVDPPQRRATRRQIVSTARPRTDITEVGGMIRPNANRAEQESGICSAPPVPVEPGVTVGGEQQQAQRPRKWKQPARVLWRNQSHSGTGVLLPRVLLGLQAPESLTELALVRDLLPAAPLYEPRSADCFRRCRHAKFSPHANDRLLSSAPPASWHRFGHACRGKGQY